MHRCALLLFVLAACSSSSAGPSTPPPCNQDPWECSSAQTCWPESVSAFDCLNAGPGALGAACENTVGSPTCGARLACFQSNPTAMGACLAYCSTTDPSHACTGGAVCETAFLGGTGGPEFSICMSPNTGDDAGTPADGGAGDASGGCG